MAKKLTYSMVICTVLMAFSSFLFANESFYLEPAVSQDEPCTAPPPKNFRITSIGSSFVSLSWHPAWVGAVQSMEVSKKQAAGDWTTQKILDNLMDSTCMVDGLEPGKEYRFKIATKCSNGDPSELTVIKDGITLIIDLTILGRTPINPTPVGCNQISLEHNWVGYRVEYKVDGISMANLFELQHSNGDVEQNGFSDVKIARVILNHPIVAVDNDGSFPKATHPVINDVSVPYRMDRLIGDGTLRDKIGYVNITKNSNPPSVDICPDFNNPQQPWKIAYTFTPLVAEQAINLGGSPYENRSFDNARTNSNFMVQNPITDIINIFVLQPTPVQLPVHLQLYNINAQIVLEQRLELSDAKWALPVDWLASGIYVLRIETLDQIQYFKILKPE